MKILYNYGCCREILPFFITFSHKFVDKLFIIIIIIKLIMVKEKQNENIF